MRLPFLPEPPAASDTAAVQGASLQLTAAEQAVFAGLLALAVQPKAAQSRTESNDPAPSPTAAEDESSAPDDPLATLVAAMSGAPVTAKPADPKPGDPKPIDTSGDLTGSANTLNASMIVRDLGALQPQFRTKLDRVISRMKDEYGHSVSVTETYRSQARQDQLLQQGRTTSGPVVTWTSHSLHTQGRAADLQIDGTWNNPVGFQHLQEIAAQEGLSTLGPRDPGHVELRADSLTTIASMANITEIGVSGDGAMPQLSLAAQAATVLPGAQLGASGLPAPTAQLLPNAVAAPATPAVPSAPVVPSAQVAPVAHVAAVAHVAPVARVAQVARLARIARATESVEIPTALQAATSAQPAAEAPSESSAKSAPAAPPAGTAKGSTVKDAINPATAAVPPGGSSPDTSSDHRDRRRDQSTPQESNAAAESPSHAHGVQPLAATAAPATTAAVPATAAAEIAPIAGTDAAARAAAVIAMQDARDAQPVSHMMLQLDNGEGGLDRIRVGLRGSSVGATIDMASPTAATEVAANIHQLAAALQSRGLDPDSLRVRVAGTVGTAPTTDLSRVLAAGGEVAPPTLGTLFAQASSSSSSSRGDAQGQQPQQNPSRQRARKDQQGDQQ